MKRGAVAFEGSARKGRSFKQVLIWQGGESSIIEENGDALRFSFQGYSPDRRR